jgi:hypothetical protein
MTISNSLTLSGATIMELNAATGTNDLVRGLSSVNYGGSLTLSNLAGTITALNTFKLFSATSYHGAFAALTPTNPGQGLAWNTNTLAADGTLRVVSTSSATIALGRSAPCTPPSECFTVSWPVDHIDWRLQALTNSYGLGTNWLDVPNSIATGQMTFPLDPAAGCVFYRLVYP